MSHNSRQKGNKNGFSIFYIKNLKQLEEKMEFQLSRELDHCLAFYIELMVMHLKSCVKTNLRIKSSF